MIDTITQYELDRLEARIDELEATLAGLHEAITHIIEIATDNTASLEILTQLMEERNDTYIEWMN